MSIVRTTKTPSCDLVLYCSYAVALAHRGLCSIGWYVLSAVKMMYQLDQSSQAKCIAMATNLSADLEERTVLVLISL